MLNHKKIFKSGNSIILIYIILIIALIFLIGMYADIKDYRFWLAAIIEIFLAIAWFTTRRYSYLVSNLIFLFSIIFPIILPTNINYLRPIGGSLLVFLASALGITTYSKYNRKIKNRINSVTLSRKFPFTAIFPADLPSRFTLEDYHISKKKLQSILELDYRSDNSAWFWIQESNGVITRNENKLLKQKLEKIIKNTSVIIMQEIPQNISTRKKEQSLYFEADWNHRGIYFNLSCIGIPLENIEKIISSMIN